MRTEGSTMGVSTSVMSAITLICPVSPHHRSRTPNYLKYLRDDPECVWGQECGGDWPSLLFPQAQASEAEGRPRPVSKERPL